MMLEFRHLAASIMLMMGTGIVFLNGLVLRNMRREKEGFHKICMNKAVANIMIACSFMIWAAPCSILNRLYLPYQFNIFFGDLVGWAPYLISGPFTQICLAVNRSIAICFPYHFGRSNKLPYTKIAMVTIWLIAIVVTIPSWMDGCSYIFFVEAVSWGPMDTNCSRNLSAIVTQAVFIMAIISFSINASSILKIIKMSAKGDEALSIEVSKSRRKRRKLMFIQCIIQDCTHTMDCMINTYVYTFYDALWFQFLCGSVSALTVIFLDGFLMSVFHSRTSTPAPTKETVSRLRLSRHSSAFITTTTL